jgi:alkylhydroperoxidase family enzyme
MSWLDTVPADTQLEAVLRTDAPLFDRFRDFAARIWSEGLVDPVVLELCRLRIATLHNCRAELVLRYEPAIAAGLDEAKIAALPQYSTSERFTEHERACVALAEQFAMDAHLITDDDFARAAADCSPAEMSALVTSIAFFDGSIRIRLMLGIEPPSDGITVVPAPMPERGPIY